MTMRRLLTAAQLFEFRAGRAEFYRDLAEMYRRGEALLSFLEGEIANAQLVRASSRVAALRLILQRHQGGENASLVSHLLAGVVPRADGMLLLAVDRAEDKPRALVALADAIDRQRRMARIALSYAVLPAVTLPLCCALIALLGRVILAIDETTPVYARAALWGGINGWARDIAAFAQDWGPQLLLATAMAIAALAGSLPRWRGAGRLRVEAWPVYGLYRDFQAGMLFCAMAMLLQVGETLQGSIEDVAQRASPWLRWHLGRVLESLEENPNATLDAFRRGLLSPHLLSRAATLSRSCPAFADVLVLLGTVEGERVVQRVRRAAFVANGALVGVFAAVATFMGVASMTVPGQFATLMEPSTLMTLRAQYEAAHPHR